MTNKTRILRLLPALAFCAFLAACGGGGSGTSPSSSVIPTTAPTTPSGGATPTPTPTPTATATSVALAVTGTATEFTSGTPLSGFTVTVGAVPAFTTCLASQSATSEPCGVAAAPTVSTTTSSTGAFSIAVPSAGTYFLTIALNSTYATLHKEISVAAGGLALGTVHVAALTSDEQNWLADVNSQRATVSFPTSFPNLVVDEYAEENARAMSSSVATGAQPFGDATESIYDVNYETESGQILGAGSAMAVENSGQYTTADTTFMSEKANCPSGNWQTCAFSSTTGHYINISNTADVWVGLGEVQYSASVAGYPAAVFSLIFPQDTFGPAPASLRRRSP